VGEKYLLYKGIMAQAAATLKRVGPSRAPLHGHCFEWIRRYVRGKVVIGNPCHLFTVLAKEIRETNAGGVKPSGGRKSWLQMSIVYRFKREAQHSKPKETG